MMTFDGELKPPPQNIRIILSKSIQATKLIEVLQEALKIKYNTTPPPCIVLLYGGRV